MSQVRLRYQTIEVQDLDVHLKSLRDRQQFNDDQGLAKQAGVSPSSWPLFGVVWESGVVLAQLMHAFDIAGKRILEVGCGLGLSSLVLNQRQADITATDYNPEAGAFLLANVELNGGPEIPFFCQDWAQMERNLERQLGRFDLIIGADLLYEPDHVTLLSAFIDRHAQPQCECILIDPGRGLQNRFSREMEARGFSCETRRPDTRGYLELPYKGKIFHYRRTPENAT